LPASREAHLMAAVAADRELLFGLLALQNGLTRIIHDACPRLRNSLPALQFGRC
jgi:hypothetical protein